MISPNFLILWFNIYVQGLEVFSTSLNHVSFCPTLCFFILVFLNSSTASLAGVFLDSHAICPKKLSLLLFTFSDRGCCPGFLYRSSLLIFLGYPMFSILFMLFHWSVSILFYISLVVVHICELYRNTLDTIVLNMLIFILLSSFLSLSACLILPHAVLANLFFSLRPLQNPAESQGNDIFSAPHFLLL